MNAAAGRRREHPVLEDRQIEHRRAAAALDQTNSGSSIARGDQAADDERVVPPLEPAARDAVDEPGQPGDEGERPEQVEPAHGVALRELAQHEAPHSARPGRAGR